MISSSFNAVVRTKVLVSELTARLLLLLIFLVLEHQKPFMRLIHKEELWLYQNPTTESYVSGTKLWLFIVLPAPFLPLTYHFLTHKYQKYQHRIHDILSAILAVTLLLPLNGVITNVIKLSVGRPRPDFAYRCWPQSAGEPPNDDAFKGSILCHGDPDVITEGRKSFPSGHSSFSFAVYVFCFLYLSGKLRVFVKNRAFPSQAPAFVDGLWIWKFLFVVTLLIGNLLPVPKAVDLDFLIFFSSNLYWHLEDL